MKFAIASLFMTSIMSLTSAKFQIVLETGNTDGPSFHAHPKHTDDFCENDGYWISKGKYSNEWSEIICAQIGKVPVIVDQNNFNHVGFSLAVCNGEESTAWIGGFETEEFCVIYKADSFFCGSILDGQEDCYNENVLSVICQ